MNSNKKLNKYIFEYGRKAVGKSVEIQKMISLFKMKRKIKIYKNKSARF